jgi:methionine synthase I (cobalamin-dependent)
MNRFNQLLESTRTIILDGAMGTMLIEKGLRPGQSPETWNIDNPEFVRSVHEDYIQAGSQVILTNTFGGNSFRLAKHHLEDQIVRLNKAAVKIAKEAVQGNPSEIVVAGSMGPLGELIKPYGKIEMDQAIKTFAEQAAILADSGVDVIWIETLSDLKEVEAAIEGTRGVTELPVTVTLSFDTHEHTMMGVSPAEAIKYLSGFDLSAAGANCGRGYDSVEKVIQLMQQEGFSLPLIAKANAGIPKMSDGKQVYDATPEAMAEYALRVKALGAKLIGACCGSNPSHIKAMAQALKKLDQN